MDETQTTPDRHWQRRFNRWQKALDETGLGGVSSALLEASQPLAPVAVQLLWVAQPIFALFGKTDTVDDLARLLERQSSTHVKDAAHEGQPTSSESR